MQTEVNLKSISTKKEKVVYKKKLRPDEIRTAWIGRIFIWIMILITLFPIVGWRFPLSFPVPPRVTP